MRVLQGLLKCSILTRLDTVLAPGLSKNVITVGATHSNYTGVQDGQNYITYFSSRGDPAKKRILPDITAPGIVMAAMSLSEEDCKNNCDDHTNVFLNAGTYPFDSF